MKSVPRGRFKRTRRAGRRFVAAIVVSLSLFAGLSADENLTESLYRLVLQHSRIAAEKDAGVVATGLSVSASRVPAVDAVEGDFGDRLAAIRETIAHIAKAILPVEFPLIEEIEIPLTASDSTEEFLVEHARFQNERAQIVNATRAATPEVREQMLDAWEEQTAGRLAAQNVRGFEVGQQQPALRSVPNLAPPLAELIREYQTLLDGRTRITHEARHLSAAEQATALRAWEEQTTARTACLSTWRNKLAASRSSQGRRIKSRGVI